MKIIRSEDLKTIGIKASKQDETAFSDEEKVALRTRSMCNLNTALMVEKCSFYRTMNKWIENKPSKNIVLER